MKKLSPTLFMLMLALAMLFSGCSKDDDGNSVRLKSADISGAKYLAIGASQSTSKTSKADGDNASSMLYKVDANGNVSLVIFYFETENDADGQWLSENISIVPEKIAAIGDRYLWLQNCRYHIPSGTKFPGDIADAINAIVNREYCNYLLRLSDGNLFEIESLISSFPDVNSTQDCSDYCAQRIIRLTQSGNAFFMLNQQNQIVKVSNSGDDLVVEDITDQRSGYTYEDVLVDANANVYGNSTTLITNALYFQNLVTFPDKSVAQIPIPTGESEWPSLGWFVVEYNYQWYAFFASYADVYQSEILTKVYRVNISGKSVTTTFLASCSGSGALGIRGRCYFETANGINIGYSNNVFYFNPQQNQLTVGTLPDGFPPIISDHSNTYSYAGKSYTLSADKQTITEYDLATLTTHTITCDRSAVSGIIFSGTPVYRSGSNYIEEYGNRSGDGSPVMVYTDCSTGVSKVADFADGRTITTLFAIN